MSRSPSGGAAVLPENAISDVEGWLEYEEILRHSLPHALLASKAPHMRRLATALEGQEFLVGESLSLADIALFGTLLPTLSRQPVHISPVLPRCVSCTAGEMANLGACDCSETYRLASCQNLATALDVVVLMLLLTPLAAPHC